MAATYSTSASGSGTFQTSITTATLTVGASDNYALVLIEDDNATAIASVVACGQTCSSLGTPIANGRRVSLYGAASPTVGAGQSATVTWANADCSEQHVVLLVAAGVSSVADYTTATGAGTAVSVTVTNVTADDLVVDMVGHGNVGSVDAGQTERYNGSVAGVSTQPGSAGGVMSWTANESLDWAAAGIRFVGSAESGAPGYRRLRFVRQA